MLALFLAETKRSPLPFCTSTEVAGVNTHHRDCISVPDPHIPVSDNKQYLRSYARNVVLEHKTVLWVPSLSLCSDPLSLAPCKPTRKSLKPPPQFCCHTEITFHIQQCPPGGKEQHLGCPALSPHRLWAAPQSHRMGQVERDHSGSSGPTSLPKLSHPRAHGTGLYPDNSAISPGRDTSVSLGNCSSAQSLHSKVLPRVQVGLAVHHTFPPDRPVPWGVPELAAFVQSWPRNCLMVPLLPLETPRLVPGEKGSSASS